MLAAMESASLRAGITTATEGQAAGAGGREPSRTEARQKAPRAKIRYIQIATETAATALNMAESCWIKGFAFMHKSPIDSFYGNKRSGVEFGRKARKGPLP
jgi:hypothetical protein